MWPEYAKTQNNSRLNVIYVHVIRQETLWYICFVMSICVVHDFKIGEDLLLGDMLSYAVFIIDKD